MYQPKHAEVIELMKGAYDLHMHPAPDIIPRSLNDFAAAQMADDFGMAGILIKNHIDSTAARAAAVNATHQFKTKVYGGLVLNLPAGGLNPWAVDIALKLGAKVIWMPTVHARNQVEYANVDHIPPEKSIRLFDEEDHLKPEIYEILDLIKEHDAVVATGHISLGESVALCKAARPKKVKTVLTHPDWACTLIPIEIQKQLAELGVLIEKLWFDVGLNYISASYMAQTMKDIGFERCYLSTDRGQADAEYPVEGLMMFMDALMDEGLHREDIYTMTHTTPGRVVS